MACGRACGTWLIDGNDIQEVDLMVAADAVPVETPLEARATSPSPISFSPGYGTPTTGKVSFQFGHGYDIWSQGAGGFPPNGVPWAPDGSKLGHDHCQSTA